MLKSFTAAGLIAGLAAPALAQETAELPPPEEKNCRVIATTPENDQAQPYAVPELSVLAGTGAEGPFALDVPEGYDVQALLCQRSSLVPAKNDFEAPMAGYPLYIDTYNEAGEKTGVAALEYSEGVFTHRVLVGELDEGQQGWVDYRISQFNSQPEAAGGEAGTPVE